MELCRSRARELMIHLQFVVGLIPANYMSVKSIFYQENARRWKRKHKACSLEKGFTAVNSILEHVCHIDM